MAATEKATQIERFRETARALECDEDKDRFEAKLGKIARHKPQKPTSSPKSVADDLDLRQMAKAKILKPFSADH
ncbi:MAG: hypothetical protein EPN75_13240 [Beijerinckiaceae bacterium]|nr:MAG: hypothetical protein EPN75_13240 [Beijerinckiaceae bacterium]